VPLVADPDLQERATVQGAGWRQPRHRPERRAYKAELRRLDAALVAYRHIESGAGRGRGGSNKGMPARCQTVAAASGSGRYPVTITATNTAGRATRHFKIVVSRRRKQ
jgi:hypothetical protein